LTLGPLLPNERIDVIRKGLVEAKDKNDFEVSITTEAENMIAAFSEGYPQFIQQFAYSAFDADQDNNITESDFLNGAFKENGAYQQLGVKYFHELYFDQIGSDEYREVLRAMSNHTDGWVSKEQIRKAANIKESTLNNAISALKKRNIIIAKEGKSGSYRLPSHSFAVWIKGYTQSRTASGLLNTVRTSP
jgi:predicted transcriptional regulator